jgi:hypothetical protein
MPGQNFQLNEDKNSIYNRLVKSATNLLGWEAVGINALDPIVGIFLGATADEFELLYQDLKTYQSRILERLSSLLLPDVNKSPKPAHAVAFAQPKKDQYPVVDLDDENHFFFKKKNPGAVSALDSEIDVYFTSIGDCKIFDAELKYSSIGGKVYSINGTFYKDLLAECSYYEGYRTTIWFGLSIGKELDNLNGLRLFFDWPTLKSNEQNPDYLNNCNLFLGNQKIDFKHGLGHLKSGIAEVNTDFVFEPNFDSILHVSNFYNNRFLTIEQIDSATLENAFFQIPPELGFGQDLKQKLGKEKLIWLRLELSPETPSEVLQEMVMVPNAFPVLNRKKSDFTFRIQNNLNLVPIETENDFFLGVDSVVGGDGSLLKSSLSGLAGNKEGSYILRRGGISRFDSRDARTLLNHLIDLLRQENSSYKMMGFDVISDQLTKMEQLINSIEQKTNKEEVLRDETTFLFVNPLLPNDTLFISYWTTNGNFANKIKAGTKLSGYNSTLLADNSIVLCTNTLQGEDPLPASRSLDAFKNALLTRERVVSKSDIRHFCKAMFGSDLQEVELKEVFRPAKERNKGFQRVISVQIKLSQAQETELETLARTLKTNLEQAGGIFNHFEVLISAPLSYA